MTFIDNVWRSKRRGKAQCFAFLGEAVGRQRPFLENLRLLSRKRRAALGSATSRRDNIFIREAPVLRTSLPSAVVSSTYFTLARTLAGRGEDSRYGNNYILLWWKFALPAGETQRENSNCLP
ncbi:uncharacterized protein TM35_000391300 [Trypanosoma theileri]|uniref:Uncharacterized protein n=1 Tax=Trypanosoma theileri TaxID=67003 RepID=A0A1X0NJU8_9TRYP|nr:uncharacterized protein TM35_000391300 [Trypanosoma theileri]ORC84956.1 hypothetical protein TM35_000391300 [Trypanosoma theileri]